MNPKIQIMQCHAAISWMYSWQMKIAMHLLCYPTPTVCNLYTLTDSDSNVTQNIKPICVLQNIIVIVVNQLKSTIRWCTLAVTKVRNFSALLYKSIENRNHQCE